MMKLLQPRATAPVSTAAPAVPAPITITLEADLPTIRTMEDLSAIESSLPELFRQAVFQTDLAAAYRAMVIQHAIEYCRYGILLRETEVFHQSCQPLLTGLSALLCKLEQDEAAEQQQKADQVRAAQRSGSSYTPLRYEPFQGRLSLIRQLETVTNKLNIEVSRILPLAHGACERAAKGTAESLQHAAAGADELAGCREAILRLRRDAEHLLEKNCLTLPA